MTGRLVTRFTVLAGAVMLAAILAAPGSASARAFGRDGRELLRVGGGAERVLSYPGNRILLVGRFFGEGNGLLRLRANGSLDRSFGGDGQVPLSFGGRRPSYFGLNDVFVQPDGRILAISTRSNGAGSDFAVERLLPGGRPDPSFGVNGLARVDLGQPFERGTAVAALPGGDIVVGGYSEREIVRGPPASSVVARLHEDGSLDARFGVEGVRKVPVEPDEMLAHGGRGRFIVAGGENGDMAMVQLDAAGSLDRSFGEDGELNAEPPRLRKNVFFDAVDEVGRAADGSLFVAGTFAHRDARRAEVNAVAIRYTPGGKLDRRYGVGGIAKVPFGGSPFIGGFAVQPSGRVVLGGQILQPKEDSDFLAVGLGPGGHLDPRLGRHGVAKVEMGGWDMGGGAVFVDGGVVLVGVVRPRGGAAHHITGLARLRFHRVR